jgi:CRP/FNR family transcriptional regulator, nitrogen oxide reductase regulator
MIDLAQKTSFVHFPDGAPISGEGDRVKDVYVLYAGRVEITKNLGPDKSITLAIAAEGDILTVSALFCHRYPATVRAISPVSLLRMSKLTLVRFMRSHPALEKALTVSLVHTMIKDQEWVAYILGTEVEVRLARTLCMLADKFGVNIDLKKRELAGLAATSVETTIRLLSRMKKEGIVSCSGKWGEISIIDVGRLQELGGYRSLISHQGDSGKDVPP